MDIVAFQQWLFGAVKSKLMWLGSIVASSPLWWDQVQPAVDQYLGGSNKVTAGLGLLILIFRAMTTQSLLHKGGDINERSTDK